MSKPDIPPGRRKLGRLKRYWFLIGLIVLIPSGVLLPTLSPGQRTVTAITSLPTSWCTGTILFLMSVTLNTGRLVESLRKPGPVLTSFGINQIVVPLLCLPLLALQQSDDLRIGLLIAGSVPCTMAAASVWTRRAGGNDAVSLLVTLLTNGLCFVVTPIWLWIGNQWFDTVSASDGLAVGEMVKRLVLAALIPAAFGQACRALPGLVRIIDANKPWFSNAAQVIILALVFCSAFRGGLKFQAEGHEENLRHTEFAVVWMCCVVVHLGAMFIAWSISGWLDMEETDRRACVFAGSQKTLPIGILVSQATGMPFSLLPMLMFHTSQLFIDTWIADRLARREDRHTSK